MSFFSKAGVKSALLISSLSTVFGIFRIPQQKRSISDNELKASKPLRTLQELPPLKIH